MAQYQLRALRSNLKTFYGLHQHLAERRCENLQSARGQARCKSGSAITWLVFTPREFLRTKYFLKNSPWKMLIEQIVEFQLRGPEPPGRTSTPKTGNCHDKTIISKENPRVGFHLLLKCCTRQCILFPPTGTLSRTIKL